MPRFNDRLPQGVLERASHEFNREFEAIMNRLEGETEPAPGTRKVSERHKVALWGVQDPRVDPVMLKQMLLTTGLGEEAGQMLVVQENEGNEELLAAYANGLATLPNVEDPEALADDMVEFARWPHRWGLLAHLADPDEMVSEAERLDRAWQKAFGTVPEQAGVDDVALDRAMGGIEGR